MLAGKFTWEFTRSKIVDVADPPAATEAGESAVAAASSERLRSESDLWLTLYAVCVPAFLRCSVSPLSLEFGPTS
jgi:hypothetical protein